MTRDAQSKRQRNTNRDGIIISISPEMPNRHPVYFRLSGQTLTLVGIILTLIIAVSIVISTRTHQAYRNVKANNQVLNTILDTQEAKLFVTESALNQMQASLKDAIEISEEKAIISQELELTTLELDASETTVSEMRLSLQDLLGQIGQLDVLVQDLQLMAGVDGEILSQLDSSLASGGEESVSFEDVAFGLSTLVGSAHDNLSGLNATISELRDTVAYKQAVLSATPRVWPVEGYVSSLFGGRLDPFSGRKQSHKGLDIVAPYKTPIKATAAGKVIKAGWSTGGYGNQVIVDHGYGIKTMYAHLNSIVVSVGDTLSMGDEVGLLGNTGYSTGPHLHYEVWLNDVPTNPSNYLP